MLASWKGNLEKLQGVELLWGASMARYTTFRIGGKVACLARPHCEQALVRLIRLLRDMEVPYILLGGASNVLMPDNFWDGVVVLNKGFSIDPDNARLKNGSVELEVGAGVRLSSCLRFCLQEGLYGLEGLAGIPGTVGGAVVMNAGTRIGTVADSLNWVELLDPQGAWFRIYRSELSPGYRSMGLPEDTVVTKACFELHRGSSRELRSRVAGLLEYRRRTQPLGWPSAGSIYRNPTKKPAWRLIDEAGLRGFSIGDAQVSKKHTNWIINKGQATAAQVIALMETIEKRVFELFGIHLQREVKVVR